MDDFDLTRINKSAFDIIALTDDSGDKEFWLSKTPDERMLALELMRQINYNYDPLTDRLQRVFEVIERIRD